MPAPNNSRDFFSSRLGILAATLGSAVGLGNIWKFPALTGQNGGASFLLVYILATLLVGLPVMIAELSIGRNAKANPVAALKRVAPGTAWWILGASGIASAVFILGFYTEVGGWVFGYIFKAIAGGISTTDPATAKQIFSAFTESPFESIFWQWVVLVFVGAIIVRGASKGIEKVTRVLMPLLFLLLLAVCVRSLTLPNAMEGMRFLFMPDFARIDASLILTALGLAFFKLSVGMGCMFTYGSYFRDDVNIPFMATRVMLLDLLVSLLAGIAIFPAVFSFGFEPTAGPSLLFMTIPAVFASMPGGQLFTVIFFALSAIAATGAMLSLMEVPVAWLSESMHLPRRRATVLIILFFVIFGAPAALSSSSMAGVKIFGMNFFDLYDFISSSILLPLNGFFACIFLGYVWHKQAFNAISNKGQLHNEAITRAIISLCRFLSPVLIVLVLLRGLKVI